jgi:hypothetical protein
MRFIEVLLGLAQEGPDLAAHPAYAKENTAADLIVRA